LSDLSGQLPPSFEPLISSELSTQIPFLPEARP